MSCLLCIGLAVMAIRCAGDRVDDRRPVPVANGNEALIVPPEARSVQRGHAAYGSFFVSYALTERFPARNALKRIKSTLKRLGWLPLKDDWLNPGLPSSHLRGWTHFVDITSGTPRQVHQWAAQWQDLSGNVVTYSLRYDPACQEGPYCALDSRTLFIHGLLDGRGGTCVTMPVLYNQPEPVGLGEHLQIPGPPLVRLCVLNGPGMRR